MPRLSMVALVACALLTICVLPGCSLELRSAASAAEVDVTQYKPSNEGLGHDLALLSPPVEYLVDPSESLPDERRGMQGPPTPSATLQKKDLESQERHQDQGVLVTLFKDKNSTMTHKELLLVSEAVDKAGASEHIPLNEHTHCVCRVLSKKGQATCFCKYQVQPFEKNESDVASAQVDDVVDSMIRTGSKKIGSDIRKHFEERRRIAAKNTNFVRQRLKQRIDAAQGMRSSRVADEFANIFTRGAEYLKSLVTPRRNAPERELDSHGLSKANKKQALHVKNVNELRSTIAKLRDATAAIRATRDETIARVSEYSQIDHRIASDLVRAQDDSSKLAKAVHENAIKMLSKVKSDANNNISGILSSMENQTRPLLLRWLKMKQNKTMEAQSEKERLRIANETRTNEEQKKRLDNAPTLEEVLKHNEQFKRLQALLEKQLEDHNIELTKLEEDQKALEHRMSELDEFRNDLSPKEVNKRDEELQKRMKVLERDTREQAYKRTKAAEASAKRRAAGLANDGRVGTHIDVAAELRKLQTMRQKLQLGREELEKEVERRWANGPGHQNEGHGCVLCKATEEIEKLEDAKKRLERDLKLCRADSNQFEPGCEEDLVFQITRLRQEVTRRRALLAQEVTRLQKEVDANKAKIKLCRERSEGCDAKVEQGVELLIKRDIEELERRAKAESIRATQLIYRCLYDHHVTQEHIPPLFARRENSDILSLKVGCNSVVKNKLSQRLYSCICDEYASEHQQVEENIARLHKVEAGNELAAATEEFQKRQEAETVALNQKAAETTEAKLVLNVVKDSPQYHEILKHLSDRSIDVTKVQKEARDDEAQAAHAEVHLHKRLDKCLSNHIEDKNVQNNLRAAFHDTGGIGNKNSAACVLLSMSKDPVVVEAHQCICMKDPTVTVQPVESDFSVMSSLKDETTA